MHPIDQFIVAMEESAKGNHEKANSYIASCFGSERVTEPIRNNVARILDRNTLLHKAILPLIVHEGKKRG